MHNTKFLLLSTPIKLTIEVTFARKLHSERSNEMKVYSTCDVLGRLAGLHQGFRSSGFCNKINIFLFLSFPLSSSFSYHSLSCLLSSFSLSIPHFFLISLFSRSLHLLSLTFSFHNSLPSLFPVLILFPSPFLSLFLFPLLSFLFSSFIFHFISLSSFLHLFLSHSLFFLFPVSFFSPLLLLLLLSPSLS